MADTSGNQSEEGGSIPTPTLHNAKIAYPLFYKETNNSPPTSPLQLRFSVCSLSKAKELNRLWHSRLPVFRQTISKICYVAHYMGIYYACAIWSNPSSAMVDQSWMELKRMAISPDAPKNTASRMIGFMVRDIKNKFDEVPNLISYQDPMVHSGTIYRASGWACTGERKSGGFSNTKVRFRHKDQAPGPKIRWEKRIT